MSDQKQGASGATSSHVLPEAAHSSTRGVPSLNEQSKSIEHEGTFKIHTATHAILPPQPAGNQPHETAVDSEASSRLKGENLRSNNSATPQPSASLDIDDPSTRKSSNKTSALKEQQPVPTKDALKSTRGGKTPSGSASQVASKAVPSAPPKDDPSNPLAEEVPDSWLVSPQVMQHIMKRRATAQAEVDEKAREKVIAEALAVALAVPSRKRTLPSESFEDSTQDATQSKTPPSSNVPITGNNEDANVKSSPHKKPKTSVTTATTNSPPGKKSAGAAASGSNVGATSSTAKSEGTRTTRRSTQQAARANVPAKVKLPELVESSSSTARGRGKGKGVARGSSKDPVKEALAITKTMTYAQYIDYIEENGPIRGGRKSTKFEGLVMFYLVQEGTSNKLGEVSRGRLDFVSITGRRACK